MPDIQSLLTPPDNWQWSEFKNNNDQPIRYGWNVPANAKTLIIIAEGRTECIEEYFEIIGDLNARGYACAIMDWQGHGKSYRYMNDNSRHHSKGFEQDISDFHEFLETLDIDLPRVLFAHSMGGNIGLRYIAEYPDVFQSAFLIAPMLGLNPKRMIKYIAPSLLKMTNTFGWDEKFAIGQSPWNEAFAHIAKHKVSNDKLRREVQPYLFKHHPELRCGGVTYGWLKAALDSIAHLHTKEVCDKITIPVFMAIADKDIVVDNDGLKKTASLLPNCKVALYERAEHQIHRECDEIRNRLFHDFDSFFEKHASPKL